jgi:TonB family protein
VRTFDNYIESNRREEAVSMTFAVGLHALILLWNPVMMRSDFKATKEFVEVTTVVDPNAGGSPIIPDAPKKTSIFGALKDMLMTSKTDQIAPISPRPTNEPIAAPKPTLKEATRRPMAMNFTPQAQTDDLAALKSPDQIKAPGPKIADMPVGGPTLQSKSFGGIKMKDIPFQVNGPESISANQVSNIPIAVGNASAKSGLGYQGPTLKETSGRRVGIVPGASGTGAPLDTMAMGSGPAPIAVGTGGPGTAPTGASSGGGGLVQRSGRGGFGGGTGTGHGTGFGAGVQGIPGAAQQLDSALSKGSGAAEKTAKGKGFEISGPLMNRAISFKVIPEYPAWAEEQGIMGSVRLYFTVDSAGNVRSGIRVTKTTGYPALDQLGIDALKKWKFAPLKTESDEGQWGIITFNFSLAG